MIPTPPKWKVTFFKADGSIHSVVVNCVKRFAVWEAREQIGLVETMDCEKITVGLRKNPNAPLIRGKKNYV